MDILKVVASQLFDAYGVITLLKINKRAVVLERVARGGGQVSWFICDSPESLNYVKEKLRPGSVISFYFDERLRVCRACDVSLAEIDKIISMYGECVFGCVAKNSIDVDVASVSVSSEVKNEFPDLRPDSMVIYGGFPERAYDGISAITFILPDEDGVFRGHPH